MKWINIITNKILVNNMNKINIINSKNYMIKYLKLHLKTVDFLYLIHLAGTCIQMYIYDPEWNESQFWKKHLLNAYNWMKKKKDSLLHNRNKCTEGE